MSVTVPSNQYQVRLPVLISMAELLAFNQAILDDKRLFVAGSIFISQLIYPPLSDKLIVSVSDTPLGEFCA